MKPEHLEEKSPVALRNEQILALISRGVVPLLPFEISALENKLSDHQEAQATLGRLLSEAMTQSSETWHDNAPADAINFESKVLERQASNTISALLEGRRVPYPTLDMAEVTLGSIVGVELGSGSDIEHMLVTGYIRDIPDDIQKLLPTDTEVATIASPIGRTMFGMHLDETSSYRVGNRSLSITVRELVQLTDREL